MLDARRLVESLLAVAGIWLLFRQLPDYVVDVYFMVSQPEYFGEARMHPFATQSLYFGANVVFGLLLIGIRRPFARWVSPDEAKGSFQAQPLVAAGTAIMAVYFALNGIIELATQFILMNKAVVTCDYRFWEGVFSLAGGGLLFVLSIHVGRLWQVLRRRAESGA